jgi:hypothetical protein
MASSARADDPVWREFHSRSAGFRAEVPAEPRLQYDEEMTLAGKVVHRHYIIEHPDARFDLERHDLPSVAVFLLSSKRLLERSKDQYVERLDLIVDSAEAIEVQGHPGLRLRFRHRAAGSVQEETRFILAGRHLYMVAAGPFLPEVRSTMVARVFSSFRICLEEGSPCGPVGMVGPD